MSTALRLELRRSRTLLLWLVIVALAYGGILSVFYPVFRDNYAAVEQYLSLFPKGLMSAFGMEGSLADPGVFFSTYIGGMLWPIVAAIAGIAMATRPTAGDLDRGFLELPLSTPLSRARYLGAAVAGQIGGMAVLAVATVAGIYLAGLLVAAPFDLAGFVLAGIAAWAFGCAIAAVTTLLAVVTLNRGLAAGAAAGGLLVMYLMNAVARIQPDLAWIGDLSVFRYTQAAPIIDARRFPFADFTVFAVIAAGAWLAALWAFRRRDLAA
jgi:ABC-2 type transport system permease protein